MSEEALLKTTGRVSGFQFELFSDHRPEDDPKVFSFSVGVHAYSEKGHIGNLYLEGWPGSQGIVIEETEPIFVSEDHRRRGIATDLFHIANDWLRENIGPEAAWEPCEEEASEDGVAWIDNLI